MQEHTLADASAVSVHDHISMPYRGVDLSRALNGAGYLVIFFVCVRHETVIRGSNDKMRYCGCITSPSKAPCRDGGSPQDYQVVSNAIDTRKGGILR